jgi:hypothetical protein
MSWRIVNMRAKLCFSGVDDVVVNNGVDNALLPFLMLI